MYINNRKVGPISKHHNMKMYGGGGRPTHILNLNTRWM